MTNVVEFATSIEEATEGIGETDLKLLDQRSDVLGSRIAFDVEAFDTVRKALGIPPEMVFRLAIRNVDVTQKADIGNGGYSHVEGRKFNEWSIVVPAEDSLKFSDEALAQINSTFYKVLRFCVVTRTFIYLFKSKGMATALIKQSHQPIFDEASIQAQKLLDDGVHVLVPSSQETFLGDF